MQNFGHSLVILSVLVLFANLQQITGQLNKPSPSSHSCEKNCHSVCLEYIKIYTGNSNGDFNKCVESKVHCSCGFSRNKALIGFGIVVVVIALIILGFYIQRYKQKNYNRMNTFAGATAGPIRPDIVGTNPAQPVVTHNANYPVSQNIPPVYPQAPYNPEFPNYIPHASAPTIQESNNEEDPPSYLEVIRSDAAAMHTAGWNIGSSLENSQSK